VLPITRDIIDQYPITLPWQSMRRCPAGSILRAVYAMPTATRSPSVSLRFRANRGDTRRAFQTAKTGWPTGETARDEENRSRKPRDRFVDDPPLEQSRPALRLNGLLVAPELNNGGLESSVGWGDQGFEAPLL
jgi:hypothetical protein